MHFGSRLALVLGACGLAGWPAAAQERYWRVVYVERDNDAHPGGGRSVNPNRGSEANMVFGSGRLVRDARPVAPFRRVLAEDGADVLVTIGARASVEVDVDDNLTGHIVTTVENGTLKVGFAGSYATDLVPRIRITTPALDTIDLRGSSDAVVRGLRGGRLAVVSVGAGDVDASGQLDEIDISIVGSGDVDLASLQVDRVDVVINGSGDANVGSPRRLSAVVNGNGDVRYSGSPSLLHNSVHGSGSIRRVQRRQQ